MGLASNGWTFQAELTVAKVPQELDPLPRERETQSLAIKAMSTNKGPLFIGFSKSEVEPGLGFELTAGESMSLDILGPGRVWFNGANAKDKLCVLGLMP